MKFNRQENETKIGDVFASLWCVFMAVFGKQRDNEMLRDLAIEKGLSSGLRYLLYLSFVLPFRLLTWVLTPRWAWVHFVQRHVVSPLFEVAFIAGDESPSKILGGIFETNLNHIHSAGITGVKKSTLKPVISPIERLIMFAKLRIFLTLAIFALGAGLIWGLLYDIAAGTGLIAAVVSFFSFGATVDPWSGASAAQNLFAAIGGGAIIGYAILFVLLGYISYILIFLLRFLVESIKSLMFADREMLIDFIDDTLHYTIAKTIELYGEDVAIDAYDLVLENVVISRQRYTMDEPHYKILEDLRKRRQNKEEADDADRE